MNLKNIPKEIKAAILHRAIEVLKTDVMCDGMCWAIRNAITHEYNKLIPFMEEFIKCSTYTYLFNRIFPLFSHENYIKFCKNNFNFIPKGCVWWNVSLKHVQDIDEYEPARQRRIAFLTYILNTYETSENN